MPKKRIVVKKHALIPLHVKLSEKEKKELFEKYHISLNELPKIMMDDPALSSVNVGPGDIIKIERKSDTAKLAVYYRAVVNG